MRRAPALFLAILALAGPAQAQKGQLRVVAPSAVPALRGALPADSPLTATPSLPAPPVSLDQTQDFNPLRSLNESPVAGAAGQCRLSCAQSYYFCLAGELSDDCPSTWGQCRAACDAPGG